MVLAFLNEVPEGRKPQTKRSKFSYLTSSFNFIKDNIDEDFRNPCDNTMHGIHILAPVHHLVLAPDSDRDGAGGVGGDRGRYFFLDPAGAQFKEGKRLPFDAELFLSELKFVDHDTLAVGVLQGEGDPPRNRWSRSGLAIVTRSGKVLLRQEYPISRPISSRPAVDVTFDVPTVIGYTLYTTVRIDLGQ